MTSSLETMLQEQDALIRKGYSVEQIHCAAVQLSAQYLEIIADEQIKAHSEPEDVDGTD